MLRTDKNICLVKYLVVSGITVHGNGKFNWALSVGFSLVAVTETLWKTAAVVSTRGSPWYNVHENWGRIHNIGLVWIAIHLQKYIFVSTWKSIVNIKVAYACKKTLHFINSNFSVDVDQKSGLLSCGTVRRHWNCFRERSRHWPEQRRPSSRGAQSPSVPHTCGLPCVCICGHLNCCNPQFMSI